MYARAPLHISLNINLNMQKSIINKIFASMAINILFAVRFVAVPSFLFISLDDFLLSRI